MRYKLNDNTIVQGDAPVTINDIQYIRGVQGLTPEEREFLGVSEIVEDPYPSVPFSDITEDTENPGKWIVETWTGDRLKSALIGYAADRRWIEEQSGLDANGMTIVTDDRSKLLLMGANILASQDPEFTTPWALPDGTTVILTAEQVIQMSTAVANKVNAVFSKYAEIVSKINDGTITTKEEVDTYFNG